MRIIGAHKFETSLGNVLKTPSLKKRKKIVKFYDTLTLVHFVLLKQNT